MTQEIEFIEEGWQKQMKFYVDGENQLHFELTNKHTGKIITKGLINKDILISKN